MIIRMIVSRVEKEERYFILFYSILSIASGHLADVLVEKGQPDLRKDEGYKQHQSVGLTLRQILTG